MHTLTHAHTTTNTTTPISSSASTMQAEERERIHLGGCEDGVNNKTRQKKEKRKKRPSKLEQRAHTRLVGNE